MRKILIVHRSEELAQILRTMLSCSFDAQACCDGKDATQHIREFQPDALIIDLLLPNKDGLTVLEEAAEALPRVILGMTVTRSDYALYRAAQLGVGYMMMDSCEAKQIVSRLLEMLECAEVAAPEQQEPHSTVTKHLLRLGISSGSDGFTQLQMSIPMYAKDTQQRICKEVYPNVAQLGGYNSGKQVEHSIRNCIDKAWNEGDRAIWAEYFPGNTKKRPSNKKFISRLAANL